ncbi:MAG: MFS transporter, partial [Halolamina sp.]
MEGDTESRGMAAVPWQSGAVYVIVASSLIGVMGVSLISPVLPELRDVFGVTDARVGLVITAYTLPGIFITPFVGLVADRIGRRRVIVPLLLLFGVAGAGIAFVETFAGILALRFLQGIGASALVTLAITLIGDFYTGAERNAVMGLNGSTIGVGAALYPVIGGALAAIRWSAPFLFFGVAVLVGVFTAVVLREPEATESTDVRTYLGRLRKVTLLPEALAVFGALFVAFTVFYGGVLTALPLLLNDQYGLTASEIGPILAMVSLATAAVSSQYGRISAWREAPELVALGFVAYGASLLGVRVAPSPAFVGVALLAFGVGFGIVMPSIDTTMVTLVSGDLRAGMMGMRTSVLRIGQTVGPVGFTFLASTAFPSP